MERYWLIAIFAALLPLASAASPDQSYENAPEVSGYSSEEPGSNAYLGVDIADVTPDRLSALKLNREQGVEVTMVDRDAPAAKAGLKEHDVILTMNGTAIENGAQLRRMIHETPPGRVIALGISRDGQPLTIKAQLGERDKFVTGLPAKSFHIHMPPMPPMPEIDVPVSVIVVHSALRSGLMVENLTPQLGDYFGAKQGQGVLVRSVETGSRADKAGFRAGDVIVRVDRDPVHDSSDFSHSLWTHRGGGPVSVGIIRDKREQTLTLSIPERRQGSELFGDEKFDLPDIDASIDLERLTTEMARLQPQMEFAIQKAGRVMDDVRKSLCHQKQWLEEERKVQNQMRRQNLKIEKQWNREQREIERELEQFEHSSNRSWI